MCRSPADKSSYLNLMEKNFVWTNVFVYMRMIKYTLGEVADYCKDRKVSIKTALLLL